MQTKEFGWEHDLTSFRGAEYFVSETGLPYVTTELPGIGGRIKTAPSHFQVVELFGPRMAADQTHDKGCCHVFLTITRENLSTWDVQNMLGSVMGLQDAKDVGVCGLKDRNAVCTQTFSVPSRYRNKDSPEQSKYMTAEEVTALIQQNCGDQLSVGKTTFNSSKLRRNSHSGNRFRVVVSDLTISIEEAIKRCSAIRAKLEALGGWPNYYGTQRFGKGTSAALKGMKVLKELQDGKGGPARKRLRCSIAKSRSKSFAVAAFASVNFNAWLAMRVQSGNFATLIDGDLVSPWKFASEAAPQTLDAIRDADRECLSTQKSEEDGWAEEGTAGNELNEDEAQPSNGEAGLHVRSEGNARKRRRKQEDKPSMLPLDHVRASDEEGMRAATAGFTQGTVTYTGPMFGFKYPKPAAGSAAAAAEDQVEALSGVRESTYRMVNAAGTRRLALIPLKGLDLSVEACEEGVVFSFSLPPGCYATALLREFTKSELPDAEEDSGGENSGDGGGAVSGRAGL